MRESPPIKQDVDLGKYENYPKLKLSALNPGDVLFAINAPNPEPVHVSMVARHDKESGAVRSVHEVLGGGAEGLHITDVLPRNLLVVRCKREKLATLAADWAHYWVNYKPAPFATLRLNIAQDHEKKNKSDLVKTHRLLFQQYGKFRAIKYCARRLGSLTYPSEKDPRVPGNRGMFCSMFVALCYQVAGLQDVVQMASEETRVSDKKMTRADMKLYAKQCEKLDRIDFGQFERYLGNLHESDPYQLGTDNAVFGRKTKQDRAGSPKIEHFKYRRSLEYWDCKTSIHEFDWAAHITKGMMLDAKVITPLGLLACLEDDPTDWEPPRLVEDDPKFSETKEQKIQRLGEQNKLIKQRFHLN